MCQSWTEEQRAAYFAHIEKERQTQYRTEQERVAQAHNLTLTPEDEREVTPERTLVTA